MRHQSVDIADYENILSDVTEEASGHESVDELLQDVPEKHKRILTLMHVEGYTAKEVGKQMGMNESAVKVAAHRAIKKIREKFGT
jgi:RNA polymerase sigma-70 factor (ECF subfamily)